MRVVAMLAMNMAVVVAVIVAMRVVVVIVAMRVVVVVMIMPVVMTAVFIVHVVELAGFAVGAEYRHGHLHR